MVAVMVQGTTSSAGKSLLATGLCRLLARRGLRVAPFKAQNMSNNARVADGGEVGTAQYLQALAAGVTPHVDHNPVLLKPEHDQRSQVIVLGQVDRALTDTPWRQRRDALWPAVTGAYDRVAASADVVVIEGAGSPAEINLADTDIVNMAMATYARAAVMLVTDIDRGGAFAHLYGTWALLPEEHRRLIRGFVLNRFRGDPGLLDPGPSLLQERTGIPTLGVVPMLRHDLPDEDGAQWQPTQGGRRVRVVRGPAASNLDEWWPLRSASAFAWATCPADLDGAELIVLPGSKHVATDADWMRGVGLADAVARAHGAGVPILAVCGGAMLLGSVINDPGGVEGSAEGLGLLPIDTTYATEKTTVRARRRFSAALPGAWAALSALEIDGYDIRYGHIDGRGMPPAFDDGSGVVTATTLAITTHGAFERAAAVTALTGRTPGGGLEATFDLLADVLERHVDVDAVLAAAGRP